MQVNRRKRVGVLTLFLSAGFIAACGLWLRAQQRQYALNRQLIAALVNSDTRRALMLVNQGADPNTRYRPNPVPSLHELLNQLLRRSSPPVNESPTAFITACGTDWNGEKPTGPAANWKDGPDDSPLVQAMLAHGADVNAHDDNDTTPLIEAVVSSAAPEMIDLLLKHGARINSQDIDGVTALRAAVFEDNRAIVRQLLAHGADPNLAAKDGRTPLWLAQHFKVTEIVNLLKQAGAKE